MSKVWYRPAAVVVATHEHFSASTADGAVGLVAIVVVLVGALQEGVLPGQKTESGGRAGGESTITTLGKYLQKFHRAEDTLWQLFEGF